VRAQSHRAAVRPKEAGAHLDRRRLAGAVRSEKAEHLVGKDGEVQLIDRSQAAESLRYVFQLQYRIVHI